MNSRKGDIEAVGQAGWGNNNSNYYDMTGKKYLVVVDQHTFESPKHSQHREQLTTRHGTEHDVDRLKRVFNALGFLLFVLRDNKYQDIIHYLTAIASLPHMDTSCICIAILTHGQVGGTLCAADRPYPLKSVMDIFETRNLVNKPKVFIVQACRGHKVDRGHRVTTDGPDSALTSLLNSLAKAGNLICCQFKACGGVITYPDNSDSFLNKQRGSAHHVPSYADTFIVYAAVEGFVSYRFHTEGTLMVQALCDSIEQNRKVMHLEEIFIIMKRLVAEETSMSRKQMPVTTTTTTKFLKL